MTIKETIKTFLEDEPRARLRVNRYRTIATIMLRAKGLPQTKEALMEYLERAESINRLIRMTQQEYPELRDPTDNEDTVKALEQKVQLDLGYEPGLPGDVKRLGRV